MSCFLCCDTALSSLRYQLFLADHSKLHRCFFFSFGSSSTVDSSHFLCQPAAAADVHRGGCYFIGQFQFEAGRPECTLGPHS